MTDHNTTVHYHGLSQKMTPYADGTVISQWPIAPGKWFEYQIKPTQEDVGSRYYHAHVGLQAMSASGPLIIEDDNPPFEFDEERTVMIADWYNKTEDVMTKGLLANPFVWLGSANHVVVNGKAYTGEAGWTDPPHVIDVDYGKTYLLRWIGAQGTMYYSVAILGHNQRLVEADGTYLRPLGVQTLEFGAGQRYGTLLKTKSAADIDRDKKNGCYWVRLEAQWRKPSTHGWALLRYPSCKVTTARPPTVNNSETLLPVANFGWVQSELAVHPKSNIRAMPSDAEVTRRQIISIQQDHTFPGSLGDVWRQNHYVYNEETTTRVPYLIQLYLNMTEKPSYTRAMNNSSATGWDELSKTYVAKQGEVLDIVLINRPSLLSRQVEIHPMHFHSSKAWHLASGHGNFSDKALAAARRSGYKNPVPRDTFNIWPEPGSSLNATDILPTGGAGGWTVLRYEVTAEESGVWPLHCHILAHQVMGMSSTFAFDVDGLASRMDGHDPNYLIYGKNVMSPLSFKELGVNNVTAGAS
ncbi:Cupredoxin [Jaminaea rosea]|uniref:laccase n=1 Tax=Jaminaea rosea TaxID=1569628 RepID=A0A316V4E8_9BASI|nr:Cupredoxin [Jaminaea rosea]PWN30325.1 Cupredoxin [Jaminaea rosea]